MTNPDTQVSDYALQINCQYVTPAEIAASLNEAERTLMLRYEPREDWIIFTYWPDEDHLIMQRLQMKKLFDWAPHWNTRWNSAGLAVRAILIGEKM